MDMAENIEQLYSELADFIRTKDDQGVRRVYRDLFQAGRTRSEVMGEVIRLNLATLYTVEGVPGRADPIGLKGVDSNLDPKGSDNWLESLLRRARFSQRRAHFGCRRGTFSPSRRQIRSTRLSLISPPARRSNSAILRLA